MELTGIVASTVWPRKHLDALAAGMLLWNESTHLADIVYRHRDADKRANGDEDLADGEHNPVEMVLERCSDKSETDWHQDEVCGPQGV